MSHMVDAGKDLIINDLDCLAAAAKECGLELVRGQKTHRWFGRWVGDYPLPAGFTKEDLGHCEHAIRIPNKTGYEIGVTKRRDGKAGFTLLYDFWQGGYGLEAKAGKALSKLLPQYTAAVTKKQLGRQGYRVQSVQQRADGTLELELVK